MTSKTPKLFTSIQVGPIALQHRVVLAPLTRLQSQCGTYYYSQRASKPGSLLIAEATHIAAQAGGYDHLPGIWSPEQIKAGHRNNFKAENPAFPYVSASDVQLSGHCGPPRALTVPEIKEYVALYAQAAKNAIAAGCDGVEIHGANGYLIDQFLQDVSNRRTDEYGGSVENRTRFALEVVDAIVAAVGAERTAIRFSPWSPFQDMGMTDPIPTFSYIISQLAAHHPTLAYIHLVEPRISGNTTCDADKIEKHESNDVLCALWAPRPVVRAGGYSREGAIKAAEGREKTLVAFGRFYISNPDLPTRLEEDIPLNPFERATFYLVGEGQPTGVYGLCVRDRDGVAEMNMCSNWRAIQEKCPKAQQVWPVPCMFRKWL
ncbi:NADH:flavin oxidoreductase/NADH oxidase [Mycena olivaceomarginata]|nr:NADH:flavin oxidoreductase/NADH oxidase [Mycena olivaceomarginata]